MSNVNVLQTIPALQSGLSETEKRILNSDDSQSFVSTINLVKTLKHLTPDIRRKVIDSIVKELGKDNFLISLADYMDGKK